MKVKKVKCLTEKDAILLFKLFSNLGNFDFIESLKRKGRTIILYYFTEAK